MDSFGQQASLFLEGATTCFGGSGGDLFPTAVSHAGQFVKLHVTTDALLAKIDAYHFNLLRLATQDVEVLRVSVKFSEILSHLLFIAGRNAENLRNFWKYEEHAIFNITQLF